MRSTQVFGALHRKLGGSNTTSKETVKGTGCLPASSKTLKEYVNLSSSCLDLLSYLNSQGLKR